MTHTNNFASSNKAHGLVSPQGKLAFLQGRMLQPETVPETPDVLQRSKHKLPIKETLRITGNTVAAIVVAFFPKCPMCWAGYMSLFGAIGLQSIPYTPQVLFLFIAGMAANLCLHYRLSRKRRRMRAFALNLVGVAAVICGYFLRLAIFSYSGIILLIISSVFINLPWSGIGKKIYAYRRKFTE